MKVRLISIIHIFGFSLALACCLVTYQFYSIQFSMDDFHKQADRVYMITQKTERAGKEATWEESPFPLAPALKSNFEEVEKMTRVLISTEYIKVSNEMFSEEFQYVDSDFFEIFSFPLLVGSIADFEAPGSLVISAQIAEKYFGDKNPVGREIEIPELSTIYTIAAVFDKFPENASFRPSIVAPLHSILGPYNINQDDWYESAYSFVRMKSSAAATNVGSQLDPFIKQHNLADPDWNTVDFPFISLENLSLESENINGVFTSGSTKKQRQSLLILTLSILILALFNYVNLAIASSSSRLKEIGIRKVMGSSKYQLVQQFIFENLVKTLLSLLLAFIWAQTFLIPGFRSVFSFDISLQLSSIGFWIEILSGFLVVVIVSAIYPAVYLSSFRPAMIFRSKSSVGTGSFAGVLITLQLIISFVFILGSLGFVFNNLYLQNKDWGYNKEQLVVIPGIYSESKHRVLYNELSNDAAIAEENITSSKYHVGTAVGFSLIKIDGEQRSTYSMGVGANYFDVMGIKLKEGRSISANSSNDKRNHVLVNEAFIDRFGGDKGIEQLSFVFQDSINFSVVGIVEDFHFYPFYEKISPMFFYISEPSEYHHIIVRAVPGQAQQVYSKMETAWNSHYPDELFQGFYQDKVFDDYLVTSANHGLLVSAVAIIAIIISSMGLFGMVSLNFVERLRELSIRKVLGASDLSLIKVFNKGLLIMIAIALFIAVPVGHWIVSYALGETFTYSVDIDFFTIAYGFAVFGLIIIFTLLSIVIDILKNNPIEYLKDN